MTCSNVKKRPILNDQREPLEVEMVGKEPWAEIRAQRRAAMTWAQRLKRVFEIDIESCDQFGDAVKVLPASGTRRP